MISSCIDIARDAPGDGEAFDAQIVEALKRREERAMLIVYDRYGRSIHRFLVHMTGSISTADDLTQEVFTILLNAQFNGRLRKFDPNRGTLEGYLLGIARRLAKNEYHRGLRSVPLESEGAEGPLHPLYREEKFADALAEQQHLSRLQQAISELPIRYREVLVMCCLEDRSYEEAARIVGCSVGTVASRIHRAKVLLAARLKNLMGDPHLGDRPREGRG